MKERDQEANKENGNSRHNSSDVEAYPGERPADAHRKKLWNVNGEQPLADAEEEGKHCQLDIDHFRK